MILKTERLILREFTENDLDALAPILADPQVMRFSINGPMNREKAEELLKTRVLAHYAKHGFGRYAVIYQDQLIGFVGLLVQTIDGEDRVELAIGFFLNFGGRDLPRKLQLLSLTTLSTHSS